MTIRNKTKKTPSLDVDEGEIQREERAADRQQAGGTPITVGPGFMAQAFARSGVLFFIKGNDLIVRCPRDIADAVQGMAWLASNSDDFVGWIKENPNFLKTQLLYETKPMEETSIGFISE